MYKAINANQILDFIFSFLFDVIARALLFFAQSNLLMIGDCFVPRSDTYF
jgi:hypothetical protein